MLQSCNTVQDPLVFFIFSLRRRNASDIVSGKDGMAPTSVRLSPPLPATGVRSCPVTRNPPVNTVLASRKKRYADPRAIGHGYALLFARFFMLLFEIISEAAMDHTSLNQIIIDVMVVFMVLGALDRCLGNRFGLGAAFEEGLHTMGALTLAMVGIICIAPVLGTVLVPIISPLYHLVGADPAMFAGTLLANDMGAFPLAQALSSSAQAAEFSGLVLGALLGVNVVFTIPVGLGLVDPADHEYFALGMLCGVLGVPFGAVVGGLTAGFAPQFIAVNLIPVALFSLVLALGLWRAPALTIRIFQYFGKLVIIVATIGLACGIIEALAGITIIPGMAPVTDGLEIVGHIAILLAGTFPMLRLITRAFRRPLSRLGSVIGVNEHAAAGMVSTFANGMAMFAMYRDMDKRGKVLCMSFSACVSALIGDHLAYTAAAASHMIVPVICGKIAAGICGLVIGLLVCRARGIGRESEAPPKVSSAAPQ